MILAYTNAAAAPITSHDLGDGAAPKYKVIGKDPYIIFNPDQDGHHPAYLRLALGEEMQDVPLELFFKASNDLFDPYYKLSFTVQRFPAFLEIPSELAINTNTRLRLDINDCDACLLDFTQMPTITSEADENIVEASEFLNGVSSISRSGRPIQSTGWALNNLEGELSSFKISGGDPYLVSPRLSTSTEPLWGVYVQLRLPPSTEKWHDFQLFYQTENYGFRQQASSNFRVQHKSDGEIEFAIPLTFLSAERPSDAILERVRLDLPELEGQWSIKKVSLLNKSQSSQTQILIPVQLTQYKHQKPSARALIKKAIVKIYSDHAFLFGYLCVLIFTLLIFIRAFRVSR